MKLKFFKADSSSLSFWVTMAMWEIHMCWPPEELCWWGCKLLLVLHMPCRLKCRGQMKIYLLVFQVGGGVV